MTETDLDPILDLQNINTTQEINSYKHNEYIGPQIQEEKQEGVFRLIGGNPNGLVLNARGGEYGEYIEEAKRMSADAIALFELNLDTHKPRIKKLI